MQHCRSLHCSPHLLHSHLTGISRGCSRVRGSCCSLWWGPMGPSACPTMGRPAFCLRPSAWPSATGTTRSLTWPRGSSALPHRWTPRAPSALRRRLRKWSHPNLHPSLLLSPLVNWVAHITWTMLLTNYNHMHLLSIHFVWVCDVDGRSTASPGLSQTDETLGLGGAAHLWCRAVMAPRINQPSTHSTPFFPFQKRIRHLLFQKQNGANEWKHITYSACILYFFFLQRLSLRFGDVEDLRGLVIR